MLKEVCVTTNSKSEVVHLQTFLHALKSALDEIPSTEVNIVEYIHKFSPIITIRVFHPVLMLWWYIQVSVCENAEVLGVRLSHGNAGCNFTFRPPTRLDLIGSFLLQSAAEPVRNIDVALQMPPDCLLPKDHLNYRYLEKRVCYLDVIAQYLSNKYDVSPMN